MDYFLFSENVRFPVVIRNSRCSGLLLIPYNYRVGSGTTMDEEHAMEAGGTSRKLADWVMEGMETSRRVSDVWWTLWSAGIFQIQSASSLMLFASISLDCDMINFIFTYAFQRSANKIKRFQYWTRLLMQCRAQILSKLCILFCEQLCVAQHFHLILYIWSCTRQLQIAIRQEQHQNAKYNILFNLYVKYWLQR